MLKTRQYNALPVLKEIRIELALGNDCQKLSTKAS